MFGITAGVARNQCRMLRPGSSTRTSTSGALRARPARRTAAPASRVGRPRAPPRAARTFPSGSGSPPGARSCAAAWAARSGSRWPATERRPPAPDRQQRHVDASAQLCHRFEQVGVAGEVRRARAADHVADRVGGGPNGRRRPSWTAGVAITRTGPTRPPRPAASSRTSREPVRAQPRLPPAGARAAGASPSIAQRRRGRRGRRAGARAARSRPARPRRRADRPGDPDQRPDAPAAAPDR